MKPIKMADEHLAVTMERLAKAFDEYNGEMTKALQKSAAAFARLAQAENRAHAFVASITPDPAPVEPPSRLDALEF